MIKYDRDIVRDTFCIDFIIYQTLKMRHGFIFQILFMIHDNDLIIHSKYRNTNIHKLEYKINIISAIKKI